MLITLSSNALLTRKFTGYRSPARSAGFFLSAVFCSQFWPLGAKAHSNQPSKQMA